MNRLIAEKLVHQRMERLLETNYPANGPRIGSKVRILHGKYRGQVGEVVDFDSDPEEGDQYSVKASDGSIRYLDDIDIELIEEDLTIDER